MVPAVATLHAVTVMVGSRRLAFPAPLSHTAREISTATLPRSATAQVARPEGVSTATLPRSATAQVARPEGKVRWAYPDFVDTWDGESAVNNARSPRAELLM